MVLHIIKISLECLIMLQLTHLHVLRNMIKPMGSMGSNRNGRTNNDWNLMQRPELLQPEVLPRPTWLIGVATSPTNLDIQTTPQSLNTHQPTHGLKITEDGLNTTWETLTLLQTIQTMSTMHMRLLHLSKELLLPYLEAPQGKLRELASRMLT